MSDREDLLNAQIVDGALEVSMIELFGENAVQNFLADEKFSHAHGCSCAGCLSNVEGKVSNDFGILIPASVTPVTDLDGTGAASPVTPDPMADTVPGGVGSTATINVGGSVDVIIETPSDHDWYQVNLTAGVAYTIQTSSFGGGSGGNPDSYLALRDASGVSLSEDDDSGDGTYSLISFTPTTSGVYFIDAGTYSGGGQSSSGSYHLSVAAGITGGDQVGATVGTASAIALGGSLNGRVDSNGDHDWYAITLTAGQTYLFRTGGVNSVTATDTTLTLRDASGTQVTFNDDSGEASFSAIRYTPTTSGTYYLDVGAFNTGTGDFNLTAFTTVTPIVYTNDQIANQLTNGYWGGSSHHFNVTSGGTITFNVQALTAAGQTLARAATAMWASVTGINFTEVSSGGDIVYDDNQDGAFANSSYNPATGITSSATVNVSTQWLTNYGTGLNTYSFQTYIHETGHALGLGHAGNYNGSASYAADSDYLNDSWATTVMSYFDQQENSYFQAQGFTRQFILTPMVADGIAISNLYGTATTTRTGDTTYGFNNNSGQTIYDATVYPSISYTIYDNGGTDTMDYSGFGVSQVINLNAETFSSIGSRVGNVSIARGTIIENAIGGSGADTITGNAAANTLTGNGGADSIYGGAGNDTINGSWDDAVLSGGADYDTLVLSGTGTLAATISGFEALSIGGGAITISSSQLYSGFSTVAPYTPSIALSGSGSLIINLGATDTEFYLPQVTGGSGVAITVNGSSIDDVIKGVVNSVNTLNGGDGWDFLRGGLLGDTINGGNGNDKITGYGGADILAGGSGADQFRILGQNDSGTGAAADRITDFVIGTDFLDFRLYDTDPVTAGVQNPGFSFIGTNPFNHTGAAEIRFGYSAGNILVQVDVDGNNTVDMEIVLQGLNGQTLTSGDFLL